MAPTKPRGSETKREKSSTDIENTSAVGSLHVTDKALKSGRNAAAEDAQPAKAGQLFSATLAELREVSLRKDYAAEANANRKLLREKRTLRCIIIKKYRYSPFKGTLTRFFGAFFGLHGLVWTRKGSFCGLGYNFLFFNGWPRLSFEALKKQNI